MEETKRHHSFSVVGHSQRWGARNGANQCAPTSLGRRSGRPGGRSTFATRISCSRCRRIGSRRPPGSSPLALHRPRASRLALLSRASRAARLARLPARSQTWVARRRLGLPPRRPHRADHAHAHARAAATATRAIGRRAYLTHCPSIADPLMESDRPTEPTYQWLRRGRPIHWCHVMSGELVFPVAARTGKVTFGHVPQALLRDHSDCGHSRGNADEDFVL